MVTARVIGGALLGGQSLTRAVLSGGDHTHFQTKIKTISCSL